MGEDAEMREELGLREVEYHPLAEVELRLAHRLVTITCVHAELADPDRQAGVCF